MDTEAALSLLNLYDDNDMEIVAFSDSDVEEGALDDESEADEREPDDIVFGSDSEF